MPPDFWDYAWKIGFPFVLVCLGLLAFYRGDIVTKAAYDDMVKEKDRQILREQEQQAELWGVVKPLVAVGSAALDKIESVKTPRAR